HPVLLAIVSLLVAGLAALWFLAGPVRDDESAGAPPAIARAKDPDRPPAIETSPSPASHAALAEGDRTPLAGASPQPEDPLGAIARTFRSDQPDLPGLENLLEQLAQQAIIDPHSIVSDEDFLRASITFPGSALVGEVSRSDGKCRVLLHTPFRASNRVLH